MESPVSNSEPWSAKWGKGERLDGGGQGDTFLVPDRTNPRGVMKLLKDTRTRDAKSRRRMFQEVSNLKILHSAKANVPQVLDDNTSDFENLDVPLFFVMERIEGKTLAKVISESKKLDLVTSVGLALSLCETFQIAFRERITHRDIKPENLIVTSLETPRIVVVDFGLSFNEENAEQLTEIDEAFDNKFVSIPERRGPGENKRDPRSDLTGICAVLFYCLTGCAPRNLRDSKNRPPHRWDGYGMSEIGKSPAQIAAMNALFDRGFNPELQNRFQTVEELEQRIREIMLPVPARLVEDLGIIASRESALLRETDRATLLAEAGRKAASLRKALDACVNGMSGKLKGSLFSFIRDHRRPGDPKEYGDRIFDHAINVQVQNHPFQIGIFHLISCKENECTVLLLTYELAGAGTKTPETIVVMRYDAKLGEPDVELISNGFEQAVAATIPKLREMIAAKAR